jgi:hypothetical protein
MPKDLQQPTALAAEHEQMATVRGSRFSTSCTSTASPSKPRRMSVVPLASHTRVSLGSPIIGPAPAKAAYTGRVRRARSAVFFVSG